MSLRIVKLVLILLRPHRNIILDIILLHLLCLDNHLIDHQRMYLRILHKLITELKYCLLLDATETWHLCECNHKQHALAVVRSHLFDLDFVEDAGAVYEVLLSVAFEHFVAEGVRLQEFGWVLDCVKC